MHHEIQAVEPRKVSVRVTAQGVEELWCLELSQPLVFGRDPSCDIVLPSPSVSRRHLTLWERAGALFARDASSHGSLVNGEPLHMAEREVGALGRLAVGPYVLELSVTPRAQVSQAVRRKMREKLLESMDLLAVDRRNMSAESMRPAVDDALARIARSMRAELPGGEALDALLEELRHEVLGLGPLEPLLADPQVSEIMVVDPQTIYVERNGRVQEASTTFTDETAVRAVLERIVTPLGRRIDESNPIVDARLKDGSRVNAVIPPLAIKGPSITIRKFPKQRLTLRDLVQRGSLSEDMAVFLARCVAARRNVVIAGGTGSGKTTLLNVLSAAIPHGERIVTIEDAAELQLAQRHVVCLESRPPNMEGQGTVSIRDLVKNALRMRPDRIVVGECRGGEALDMLQAMNTGHDGSMTTTHANSPREALQRLETLCLMAGLDLPLSAIRRQIAASVHLLIQQARLADGTRRITHVTEVVGLRDDGEVELRDLFLFTAAESHAEQGHGEFLATGSIPSFADRLQMDRAGGWP